VDEGTYSELLTETATGKKLDVSGSYLMAARRDTDGKWKIAELAWAGSQSSPR
jgi:ketosteroid isomerase-like protein